MAIQTVKTGAAVNDGTGDDARTAFTKINSNFTDTTHAASRLVGERVGNVPVFLDYGIMNTGIGGKGGLGIPTATLGSINELPGGYFYRPNAGRPDDPDMAYLAAYDNSGIVIPNRNQGHGGLLYFPTQLSNNKQNILFYQARSNGDGTYAKYYHVFYTSMNTTKDSNGFIKAASPIVKLFADKIELNDEAAQQKITFEKLGVGDYLIKGSTGFAQEGWYIEMPKDANGNVLVAVIYEQLDNNDISVKTYAKMFDEETGDIVPNTARPRDIPATRWIDLRLQALPQDDTQPLDTDETVNTNAE